MILCMRSIQLQNTNIATYGFWSSRFFYPIGFSKIIFKPTVTVSLNIQKKNSRTIQLLAATRREGYFLIILCHYNVRQLKQVNNLKWSNCSMNEMSWWHIATTFSNSSRCCCESIFLSLISSYSREHTNQTQKYNFLEKSALNLISKRRNYYW